MRAKAILALLLLSFAGIPLYAHDGEPINTEFASPFARKSGNFQFRFQHFHNAGSFETASVEFEYGFARRMQLSASFPLNRREEAGETLLGRGNVELGWRYLLAGGAERRFALSLNPEITLPAGDNRVVDGAYEAGGAIHLDLNPLPQLFTHTNVGYETPVAGFDEKEKVLFYRFAAMYHASRRWQPVLEFIGQHDFHEESTQFAVVPEIIFTPHPRWEIKAGVPLGATSSTPGVGVQLQVTWKFGTSERQ